MKYMISGEISMKMIDYYKSCITDKSMVIIMDKPFKYRPSLIFINKYDNNGKIRNLYDIEKQLITYFGIKLIKYYEKINNGNGIINNYIEQNKNLDNLDILWIKEDLNNV